MDIGWYLRRLRRMSVAEIGGRARTHRAKLLVMDLEPQLIGDDELMEFFGAVQTGFGRTVLDENDEYPGHLLTTDRTFAVRDDELRFCSDPFVLNLNRNELNALLPRDATVKTVAGPMTKCRI